MTSGKILVVIVSSSCGSSVVPCLSLLWSASLLCGARIFLALFLFSGRALGLPLFLHGLLGLLTALVRSWGLGFLFLFNTLCLLLLATFVLSGCWFLGASAFFVSTFSRASSFLVSTFCCASPLLFSALALGLLLPLRSSSSISTCRLLPFPLGRLRFLLGTALLRSLLLGLCSFFIGGPVTSLALVVSIQLHLVLLSGFSGHRFVFALVFKGVPVLPSLLIQLRRGVVRVTGLQVFAMIFQPEKKRAQRFLRLLSYFSPCHFTQIIKSQVKY